MTKYTDPKTGKFNPNRRFNLRWNGTADNHTTAGQAIEGSFACSQGWEWIISTAGFKLKGDAPGPRVFLAIVPDGTYIVAVQPAPEANIHLVEHSASYKDIQRKYREYRKDLQTRYIKGAGKYEGR